jgi:hypothetical protein
MIVSNKERFFAGGRCGVIQNHSFCCALITDRISAVVATFTGEWDSKNHQPVAEALLDETLPRKRVREIHDAFLEELDQCGVRGLDLGGAIEQVFGRARNKNIVTRYQNEAGNLLAAQ